jgi:hypothetical protein
VTLPGVGFGDLFGQCSKASMPALLIRRTALTPEHAKRDELQNTGEANGEEKDLVGRKKENPVEHNRLGENEAEHTGHQDN